jgi:hypothetical protein
LSVNQVEDREGAVFSFKAKRKITVDLLLRVYQARNLEIVSSNDSLPIAPCVVSLARLWNPMGRHLSSGYRVAQNVCQLGGQIISKTYMTRVEGENTRLRHYRARLHRKTG